MASDRDIERLAVHLARGRGIIWERLSDFGKNGLRYKAKALLQIDQQDVNSFVNFLLWDDRAHG